VFQTQIVVENQNTYFMFSSFFLKIMQCLR